MINKTKNQIILLSLLFLFVAIFYIISRPTAEQKIFTLDMYTGEYFLDNFPFASSTFTKKIPLKYLGSFKNFTEYSQFYSGVTDARLNKKDGAIIISSLQEKIYKESKRFDPVVLTLPYPRNVGKYLYIFGLYDHYPSEADPGGSLKRIYRLDLSDLSLEELINSSKSLIGQRKDDNFTILPDHRRIITWSNTEIYIIDLEKDEVSKIFSTSPGEWLVSRIFYDDMFGFGTTVSLQINAENIDVSLYSATETEDDKKIKTVGYSIDVVPYDTPIHDWYAPKFIRKITLPIPPLVSNVPVFL